MFNSNTQVELKDGNTGEVNVRLNANGLYTWGIKFPIQDGDTAESVKNRLVIFNQMLKEIFPNHAKRTGGRMKTF